MTARRLFGRCSVLLLGLIVAGPALAEDAWLRVSTPDFTVVTPLRKKDAEAWAGDFAQYVGALRDFFHFENVRLPPLTVVLFARDRDFAKYRPLDGKGKPEDVAGFFQRHESWAVAGLVGVEPGDEVNRTIFHEGVHWFLSVQEHPNPVWLEEGLAEVFSTFAVDKKQAEWGRAIAPHVQLLRDEPLLPLERLLSTAREEVFGDDTLRTNILYAESWAFVHYLIFGKQGFARSAFVGYVKLVHSGVHPDEAFRKAFGKTYGEMDHLLDDYLHEGEYFINRRPVVAGASVKTEAASACDVADALARLAVAGGRWELAVTHGRAAVAAAPDDPRGHEVLGLALNGRGDAAAARAEFELAVAHGTRDFQPYFELAQAAQTAAAGGGSEVRMAPAEARQVANRYEHAINLRPRFINSYQNLAGVIDLAEPFGPQDRGFFELGQRIFPDDMMIKIGLAVLTRREGDRAAARSQLDQVLQSAGGAAYARAYAIRLDAAWSQEEVSDRITRLAEGQKYTEAVALIDERLAEGVPGNTRAGLLMMRRQLEGGALWQSTMKSLQENRWTDARRFIDEILASAAPPSLKTQAHRILDDLDRRHLGLTAEAKK